CRSRRAPRARRRAVATSASGSRCRSRRPGRARSEVAPARRRSRTRRRRPTGVRSRSRQGETGRSRNGVGLIAAMESLVRRDRLELALCSYIGASRRGLSRLSPMGLADAFQGLLDSLPDDWTDLEIDLRISDEDRYVDAAVLLAQVNAQP